MSRQSDRREHVDDRGLLDRVEPTHRAEVDEPQRPVAQDEDVARMRVGVEVAVLQDLVEHRAAEPLGEGPPFVLARAEPIGGGVRDRRTFESLLHEHPPGAQLPVHLRDPHSIGGSDEPRHLLHRVGLSEEVELGAQAASELPEDLRGPNVLAERRAALHDVGEVGEGGEVALHHVGDARPLDLHHDRLTRQQSSLVGLADRGSGETLPIEVCEDLAHFAAELGLEHRPDALDRLGRHAVLQLGELLAHLGREDVDARGRDLSELHIDPAGLLENPPETHPLGLNGALGANIGRLQGAKAFAPRQAHELLVPAPNGDATADGPHRTRSHDEPGVLSDRQ